MPIFMMFGKYNQDSLKGASTERTKKAFKIIEKNGGTVVSMFAVLGEHDLVFTLDFPDMEKALSASAELSMMTGISFSTSPAVDVEHYDHLISQIEKL